MTPIEEIQKANDLLDRLNAPGAMDVPTRILLLQHKTLERIASMLDRATSGETIKNEVIK